MFVYKYEQHKILPTLSKTLVVINLRILQIRYAKFSEYCFYTNTNVQGNVEICISAPWYTLKRNSLIIH